MSYKNLNLEYLEPRDLPSGFIPQMQGWKPNQPVVNSVSYQDIQQTGAGTCSFLSALASCAYEHYPLAQHIRYQDKFSYQVLLYSQEKATWLWIPIYFDGHFLRTKEYPLEPLPKDKREFWVDLYQRAYFKLMGVNYLSVKQVNNFQGDYLDHALTTLTGRVSNFGYPSPGVISSLQSILAKHKPLTVATDVVHSSVLIGSHAYAILQIYPYQKTWYLRVYNPWGVDGLEVQDKDDGLLDITWKVFQENFVYFSWPN